MHKNITALFRIFQNIKLKKNVAPYLTSRLFHCSTTGEKKAEEKSNKHFPKTRDFLLSETNFDLLNLPTAFFKPHIGGSDIFVPSSRNNAMKEKKISPGIFDKHQSAAITVYRLWTMSIGHGVFDHI